MICYVVFFYAVFRNARLVLASRENCQQGRGGHKRNLCGEKHAETLNKQTIRVALEGQL